MANDGSGDDDQRTLGDHSAMQSTAKVTSRMWPASMLAKRRTASEKGRTRKVEMNSIGVTRM